MKRHHKWKENSDWSAVDNCVPSAKYRGKWQALFVLPITVLSRSIRGTRFQVVSMGTKFDQEKLTNYTWCGSLARLG